jgi:hypothetical protein
MLHDQALNFERASVVRASGLQQPLLAELFELGILGF